MRLTSLPYLTMLMIKTYVDALAPPTSTRQPPLDDA